MRRPKISLKKYFYFTLICALLLIFGINLREREIWKDKLSQDQPLQQSLQQITKASHQNAKDLLKDVSENELNNSDGRTENRGNPYRTTTTQHVQKQHYKSEAPNSEQQQNYLPSNLEPTSKPWFFRNGDYYPKTVQASKLFPHQDPYSDRIVNQLMFVPPNYEEFRQSGKLKSILLYNGLGPWNVKQGRDVFLRSMCPIDTCEITAHRERTQTADMILYKDHYIPTGLRRSANSKQVTMLYYLECPYHTQNVKVPDAINWTATYRRDSDIVAPYEKWQYYNPKIRQIEQDRNYAANKTKKVAWFVSNCGARNGRLQFAHELQKHIEVDIYGACGNYKCSRSTADKCFEILDHEYKFYLAFENSNCKDYITEKFFVNALNRNILPIVMGARPEDYEVSAPYRSYIHVDEFSSAKELAEYLNILDKDDELYNSYFKWKGTGEFINTYFWCRVCAALHDEESLKIPHWYSDVNDWWRGAGVCTSSSWRNFKARKDVISDD
ncbi:glycoprotein 3-alpha-L-fucosyltransferase A [Teleopsis dalmanni]|uniref:glycoprotein 3-alpha-L-fucosyltransferase A n=1 Tax=Teleopsis dalmanni TaxID=139649 RepID=UPI0018CCE3BB|nr:glycoprotein 3-alpha-L-fucosyltransferase A [Teleopsis dalmanni]